MNDVARNDVTVANPLGPPIRGWNGIAKALEGAAAKFRDGEPHHFERISEYGTPDLAYVLEIERTRAKIGASDELASFALRTTTVWRREVEGWKIAHRHADPITTPRPLESIIDT